MRTSFIGRQDGFTLFELMITLAMFSAIMGILMNTFFSFSRQSTRMEAILELRQETRILERILREDLQTIIYLDEFMTDPKQEMDDRKSGIFCINETLGEKDGDTIHMHVNHASKFHRSLPFDLDPEIHEVSYYLEETDNGQVRFRRREEYYVDPDITAGDRSITHTLSNNMISFDVKFYKSGETEPQEDWDSSKHNETKVINDKIPSGIEVTLELKTESGETMESKFQVNLHPDMGTLASWK